MEDSIKEISGYKNSNSKNIESHKVLKDSHSSADLESKNIKSSYTPMPKTEHHESKEEKNHEKTQKKQKKTTQNESEKDSEKDSEKSEENDEKEEMIRPEQIKQDFKEKKTKKSDSESSKSDKIKEKHKKNTIEDKIKHAVNKVEEITDNYIEGVQKTPSYEKEEGSSGSQHSENEIESQSKPQKPSKKPSKKLLNESQANKDLKKTNESSPKLKKNESKEEIFTQEKNLVSSSLKIKDSEKDISKKTSKTKVIEKEVKEELKNLFNIEQKEIKKSSENEDQYLSDKEISFAQIKQNPPDRKASPKKLREKSDSEEADDEKGEPETKKNPLKNTQEAVSKKLSKNSIKNEQKTLEKEAAELRTPLKPGQEKLEYIEETPSFQDQSKNKAKTSKKVSPNTSSKALQVEKSSINDEFPQINPRIKSNRKNSNSSKDSQKKPKQKKITDSNLNPKISAEFIQDILDYKLDSINHEKKRGSSPETPNLASPVKPAKKLKPASPDSAVWVSQQEEIKKLKEKLQEYEKIIEQQSVEITELRKTQNSSQDVKRRKSPKSSAFLPKRMDGSFFQKNQELSKKEDFDFWKINEDSSTYKEPQKLEEIAALKDLWILNMESGSQLNSNMSGKRNLGVKANPLTKGDANKSSQMRNRYLPKIPTKKDLSK